MATGFRANIFDPVLISAQMAAMQCCFYVTLGLWTWVAAGVGGIQVSLDQLFDYHELQEGYDGWLVMGAVVINSFTGALALWWVVKRAKLCLDFTVTVYFFHLVVCSCYVGIPLSWAWWLTHLVSMGLMAVAGEYLCMRSELAAIPIAGSGGKT